MSTFNKRQAALDNQQLKCKNNCGFYGNPQWSGFCSQCYRNRKEGKKPEPSSKKIQRSHSDAHESAYQFSKFTEKKKQQVDKRSKTLSRIIKRQPKENATQSPSKDLFELDEGFVRGLPLKDNALKDIGKKIQSQVEVMHKHADKSIDEQSEIMQDFYNSMFNRCENHHYYLELNPDQIDLLMDRIEKKLMHCLHRTACQQVLSECEEKDLALQKHIRSLNWITADHLGLNIKENSPEVREFMDKAIADLISMDSNEAPQEKVKFIVDCSNSIISIINLSQGVTASADEFLPAMVYIVLKANPPLLQSNIKYITSYSIPTRLRSGEGAYYFTNLCCAVAFIEDLSCESLNMSEDEFRGYMSGAILPSLLEQSPSDCEGFRLMTHNLKALTQMLEEDKQLEEMEHLIEDFAAITEAIKKCKPSRPLLIDPTPYTIPAHTDMSLVPEIFRGRVQQAPTEDILVEIDCKPLQSSDSEPLQSPASIALQPLQVILPTKMDEISAETAQAPVGVSIQPLQVLLPTKMDDLSSFPVEINRGVREINLGYGSDHSHPDQTRQIIADLSKLAQGSSKPKDDAPIVGHSINIADLNYPTELIPDSPDVEFGPFERCDPETQSVASSNPTESFMEDNLNLPMPLLPVVMSNPNSYLDNTGDSLL